MVPVPAGKFLMGSPATEPGRNSGEIQHLVTIPREFAVGKFDVTVAEFAAFADETGFKPGPGGCFGSSGRVGWGRALWRNWDDPGFGQTPSDPVVCVGWDEAQAYTAWLSKKTGKTYRLLSEAEWEYAARAGTTTERPWGQEISHDDANYGGDGQCCSRHTEGKDHWEYTSPSGSFAPNKFGLFDMIGNVGQWVADCANPTYQGAPTDGSAWQTGDCSQHVRRGGGWVDPGINERSAARFWIDHRSADGGFRVARGM